MKKNALRSVGAVLAGLLTIIALSHLTDFILENTGVFPSFREQSTTGFHTGWMLLLALVYRSIYGVAGAYVTARLAAHCPMRHALILGFIGVLLSTLGAIVMWGQSPAWYALALIFLALPSAWLGGRLKIGRPKAGAPVNQLA